MKRLLTYALCTLLVFGLAQTLTACNMESSCNSGKTCCGNQSTDCDETDCDRTDCDLADCDETNCSKDDCPETTNQNSVTQNSSCGGSSSTGSSCGDSSSNESSCGGSAVKAKAELITGNDSASKENSYKALLSELVELDGKFIFLDVGSDSCIPCKEMVPTIDDLKQNYSNFHTVFVNAHIDQQTAQELGVRVLPTQIFFDSQGNEKYRHIGYFSKDEILDVLRTNGVDITED